MKGNGNNRWHLLFLDQRCFHTHRKLEKSHFLSKGSSPPEKTIRVKKENDNVILALGNLKRYGVFVQPHIYIYILICRIVLRSRLTRNSFAVPVDGCHGCHDLKWNNVEHVIHWTSDGTTDSRPDGCRNSQIPVIFGHRSRGWLSCSTSLALES